jgi:hypothetical protein
MFAEKYDVPAKVLEDFNERVKDRAHFLTPNIFFSKKNVLGFFPDLVLFKLVPRPGNAQKGVLRWF